jgi:hypothetical protein
LIPEIDIIKDRLKVKARMINTFVAKGNEELK